MEKLLEILPYLGILGILMIIVLIFSISEKKKWMKFFQRFAQDTGLEFENIRSNYFIHMLGDYWGSSTELKIECIGGFEGILPFTNASFTMRLRQSLDNTLELTRRNSFSREQIITLDPSFDSKYIIKSQNEAFVRKIFAQKSFRNKLIEADIEEFFIKEDILHLYIRRIDNRKKDLYKCLEILHHITEIE